MTIREALKKYRTDNHISQKELAEQIGVTGITISRIESGKQVNLTNSILKKISTILTEADLKDMDDTDSEVVRLRQEIINRTGGIVVPEHSRYQKKNVEIRQELADTLEPILAELGFRPDYAYGVPVEALQKREDGVIRRLPQFDTIFDLVYKNDILNKVWVFNIALSDETSDTFADYSFLRDRIFWGVGAIEFYGGANKFSLLTDISDLGNAGCAELFRAPARNNLNCDVSVIHLSEKRTPDYELDIASFGDGRGVFDVDNQDEQKRFQALELYNQWKKSILGS